MRKQIGIEPMTFRALVGRSTTETSYGEQGYYTSGAKIWILFWSGKINILRENKMLFLTRENKFHIFKPTCNVLFFYIDKMRQSKIKKISLILFSFQMILIAQMLQLFLKIQQHFWFYGTCFSANIAIFLTRTCIRSYTTLDKHMFLFSFANSIKLLSKTLQKQSTRNWRENFFRVRARVHPRCITQPLE